MAYESIPLEGFADIVRHWQKQHDRFDYPRYTPHQITEIADNLLLYQRNSGGWPKNVDPVRILSDDEKRGILNDKNKNDTTLDNRNTYTQTEYLFRVYDQIKKDGYLKAALKGLDYILNSQYKNGGWPHTPPRTDSYYGHITFSDDVMPGVLSLLRKIAEKVDPFTVVDEATYKRVVSALGKGDEMVMRLQWRRGDELTIWAGQYDRKTLKPVGARTFELAGLASQESVSVVRYLMSIDNPSTEIIRAVESAVAWFKVSALHGIRIDQITAEHARYTYHSSDYDFVVVNDENALPVWARFYELDTNKPFMANRDGIKVFRLQDVHRERRTGYAWYGYWPAELLERDYPLWKSKIRN